MNIGRHYIHALLFAGYPIVAAIGTLLPTLNRNLSISMRALIVAICLVGILQTLRNPRPVFRYVLYWTAALVFFVIYCYRFYFDIWSGTSIHIDSVTAALSLLGSVIIPFVACSTNYFLFSNREKNAKRVVDSELENDIFYSVLYALLIACTFHLILGYDSLTSSSLAQGRLSSETFNPISMSLLGANTSIIGLYFILIGPESRFRPPIIVGYFVVMIGTFTLLAGGSRGPMIGFVFSVIVLFLLAKKSSARLYLTIFFAIVATIILIQILSVISDKYNLITLDRITNAFDRDSRAFMSVGIRLDMYEMGLDVFYKNLLFGDSIVSTYYNTYYHNAIIEVLAGTGLIGFGCLVLIISTTIRGTYRLIRFKQSQLWLLALYVQYFFMTMSSGSIWGAGIFFAYTAYFSVFIRLKPKTHNGIYYG